MQVLAPDVEFTSLLFPFLVQEHRDVTVRLVPPHELAGAIGPEVDIVAFYNTEGDVDRTLDALLEAR
jgi:hypothetical protein